MKLLRNDISYLTAVEAVLRETGLRPDEARFTLAERQGECYYLAFHTDWMKYEAYVSALDGELLGLDYEPCVDESYAPGRATCPVYRLSQAGMSA